MATKNEGTRGTSPVGRVSYQHVFQPQVNKDFPDKPKKYSLVLIFDPENMDEKDKVLWENMKKAEAAAFATKFKKRTNEMKNPFRDGNVKDGKPEYEDKIFVTFSTQENADPNMNPKVVGPNPKNRIHQESGEFYNGCYARVTYNASAFDHTAGNKGVAFYLNNIQKVKDGEKLSSRVAAEDEFESCAEDDGSEPLVF